MRIQSLDFQTVKFTLGSIIINIKCKSVLPNSFTAYHFWFAFISKTRSVWTLKIVFYRFVCTHQTFRFQALLQEVSQKIDIAAILCRVPPISGAKKCLDKRKQAVPWSGMVCSLINSSEIKTDRKHLELNSGVELEFISIFNRVLLQSSLISQSPRKYQCSSERPLWF